MSVNSDFYAILGLTSNADTRAIREAFARLQAEFRREERDPQKNPAYARLVQAFEVLNDPTRRATYNTLLYDTHGDDLHVAHALSRERLPQSDQQQLVYMLVNIEPPQEEVAPRPLNLCLVIDRSTSMQGKRLSCVKSAVDLIVGKLTPEDHLSIVTFSDRADIVVSAGPVENRVYITSQMRSVRASGATEIYQGLYAGVKELQKAPLKRFTSHLILLTDGHTYGDIENCLQLAHTAADNNIGFTAFGLGDEWNDAFLDALVAPSGGHSNFILAPDDVIDHLQKTIQGLGTQYATNIRLKKQFPKMVSLNNGFKLAPFAQPLALDEEWIHLGNLEGRVPLTFLLEIQVDPSPVETRITIPLHFLADIPSRQIRDQPLNLSQRLYILNDPPPEKPPEAIVEAVRTLNMYRMNERVWEDVAAGHVPAAVTRMKHLTTRLQQAGETQLAQQAQLELNRLDQAGSLSAEGRKKLKYGTRALLTRTFQEKINPKKGGGTD